MNNMSEQLPLYGVQAPAKPATNEPSKPRFTTKMKKEAHAALMAQIRSGWDPPESVWTLIAWLSVDLARSANKKGK